MGQQLASMIKSIDGGDDAANQVKESMDALFELGKSRNEAAWAQATSSAIKVYAPINQVLLRRQSIVASATTGQDGIVTGIKTSVGKLISGQILDGVTDIIGSALNVVLGASSGQVSQNYTYALVATELGALLRIDIDIYSFELRSQGLQNKAKNMTAITSIVSSIDNSKMTVNDLRSIVSMSFGSSPLERQKAIYDVILAAWAESSSNGGRPGASTMALSGHDAIIDGGLSPEGRQRVQALFKPSVYEERMTNRGLLVNGLPRVPPGSEAGLPKPKRTGRKELLEIITKKGVGSDDSSSVTQRIGTMGLESDDNASNDKIEWIDILIWVKVLTQPDQDWLDRFGAALSGFGQAHAFKYVGIEGGRSGSAVTFKCAANGDAEIFDTVIKYCNDTVVPSLTQSRYLADDFIADTALQYAHPSRDGTGLVTRVAFKFNLVKNETSDTIVFHTSAVGKMLLTLPPSESAVLNGSVHHLTVAPKADDQNPQQAMQWTTYQTFKPDDIIKAAGATLTALPNGGYRISLYTVDERVVDVNFNRSWSSDRIK
ncbi:hypothetical protein SMACR_00941 [Sordaria macrospora]|uniref:WGS project CABT00000000 data, contig 2.2 n=2 Tax=Sordaria macrospora TaxID=5147 RepID=F7VNI8_SORMK|nr:uncharacterized protein SMAC_00941 [Sordaria macrospora k-hell]KAA8632720.1 hypothetical protein SMACR_00941 [Sordaria macrospora]WPJ62185.1 hypothetical protein SMAC4_00941 [Sordaria macrospora]CCC06917.1 unnamed protein product [Sordaria macrospora k-hell]